MTTQSYQRKEADTLIERLSESTCFLIFIAGPRQVGKTTLVRNVLRQHDPKHDYHFVPVDQPDEARAPGSIPPDESYIQEVYPRNSDWLVEEWNKARLMARQKSKNNKYILVFDEIQKISGWSEVVKGLWDADQAEELNLQVVLLGSSPLLMQKGMSESLAGRYELIRLTHWSFLEMHQAFGFDLDDYLYFGGYPGSATFIRDETRWRDYVRTSLIEPNIEKDILMMARVDKPALLKQLFYLSCEHSGYILAYDKMLGQLQDAGNTVTLSHYLDLLGKAGLVVGFQKYAGRHHRRRASPPKLNVLNPALMSAVSTYTRAEAKADRSHWGRVVESAVGAHLYNTRHPDSAIYYWREKSQEVDYIIEHGNKLTAIEVKTGAKRAHMSGLHVFEQSVKKKCRTLIVGEGGIPIVEFLSYPTEHWLG